MAKATTEEEGKGMDLKMREGESDMRTTMVAESEELSHKGILVSRMQHRATSNLSR